MNNFNSTSALAIANDERDKYLEAKHEKIALETQVHIKIIQRRAKSITIALALAERTSKLGSFAAQGYQLQPK